MFRSLMKLPPPGSEGATQGSQGAEGALSLPGPSGSGTGKVVEVASLFMYARLLTTLPAAHSGLGWSQFPAGCFQICVVSHADS